MKENKRNQEEDIFDDLYLIIVYIICYNSDRAKRQQVVSLVSCDKGLLLREEVWDASGDGSPLLSHVNNVARNNLPCNNVA